MPKTTGLDSSALEAGVEALAGRTVVALTGAGISTDSGIPDYRGAGAPERTPMTIDQFLGGESARKRYWAGSHLGWNTFRSAAPNAGHYALAELEAAGAVAGVVTQNVDGLHLRAGSRRVVELHGTMSQVRCLTCGQYFARAGVAERIASENPWLELGEQVQLRPDGDAYIREIDRFVVPRCTICGGTLKPDVVYFGEFIPAQKYQEASALIRQADALLVAGSSLVVNSGIRFLEQAARRKLPIVIVNRGPTKGDAKATVKIDAGTSETLAVLRDRLTDR